MRADEWVASTLAKDGYDVDAGRDGVLHVWVERAGCRVPVFVPNASTRDPIFSKVDLLAVIRRHPNLHSVALVGCFAGEGVFEAAYAAGVGVFRYGDLKACLRSAVPANQYANREDSYFRRRLESHRCTKRIRRVGTSTWVIERTEGRDDVIVAVVNDYEVTLERIHQTWLQNPGVEFSRVVSTNPNNFGFSDLVEAEANRAGITIVRFDTFLDSLAQP